MEIGWSDGIWIVVEINAAEAGNGSRAEIGNLFYFVKDDGTLAALTQEVTEDDIQFVLSVMVVTNVEEDTDVRMESGQRTVGFIDFDNDVFRIVIGIEIAREARTFGVERIAAGDHEDAFAQRLQRGGYPACDGCLAAGAGDGDLRRANAIQRFCKRGSAMDNRAVWKNLQIRVGVFNGG